MTDELDTVAAEIVARTRAEQGKPRHVDDEILTRVAVVLLGREAAHAGMG